MGMGTLIPNIGISTNIDIGTSAWHDANSASHGANCARHRNFILFNSKEILLY